MLRMAESGKSGFIGKARVFGDLVEHALIQLGPLPGHTSLDLVPATNSGINKKMKLHMLCSSVLGGSGDLALGGGGSLLVGDAHAVEGPPHEDERNNEEES